MNHLQYLRELTLLYIEDDTEIAASYFPTFEMLFKNVLVANNYTQAVELYESESPDILLVDICLEKASGLDFVKKVREKDFTTPIIFLTAYTDNHYLLEAANLQVDGYVVKPMDLAKLQNAMEKCLRKIKQTKHFSLGDGLYYDLLSHQLFTRDKEISLGKKENLLLQLFIENHTKTLHKETIENSIWNQQVVSDSAIKNMIAELRKKIGKEKIINISGIGWKLQIGS